MPELNLRQQKIKNILRTFSGQLEDIYKEGLVSIIVYGSAASGEFIDRRSNLNLLVILKNTDLENLKKSSDLINRRKFRLINPLFFTEDYIKNSNDVFPIEFLDMKENYTVLFGRDVLKGLSVDTRNLRLQCEEELKGKLIALKQLYLRMRKDKPALKKLLFKSFTSVLHILRNVIRIKGRQPPYLKQDILKELALEFQINKDSWDKILALKSKQIKLCGKEIERSFVDFVNDLEKIVDATDLL